MFFASGAYELHVQVDRDHDASWGLLEVSDTLILASTVTLCTMAMPLSDEFAMLQVSDTVAWGLPRNHR